MNELAAAIQKADLAANSHLLISGELKYPGFLPVLTPGTLADAIRRLPEPLGERVETVGYMGLVDSIFNVFRGQSLNQYMDSR